MEKETNTKKDLNKLSNSKDTIDCLVSKASTEIMLNRVCNGYTEEFPFKNN